MGKGESVEIKEIVDEALKIFEKKILLELNSITDETKRYLYFIAWINRFVEDRGLGKIIITGGFAVELYTARIYRTMDVDIIVDGCKDVVEEFLKRFSERIGRGYMPTYEIISLKSIDIVSTVYSRVKPPTKVLVNELYVYVDPVEDLIATYLAGWKYWNSTEDRDKALWLLAVWEEKIDWSYLNSICREQNVLDKLIELLEILRKNPLKNNPSI
jgi:hypothetical protein